MPKAPAALAVLLFAVVLLSGCSGAKGSDGDGGVKSVSVNKGDKQGDPFEAPLPTWAIGDAWTYTFNGEPTTYVVTGETANDWIMETDSAERAFSDQRDDISRLGPQRKSDLAGSQGNDRVQFFRWPLVNGMADWTTRWDQQDVRIHVIGVNPGFAELEARLANATPTDPPLYKYTYDDTVGWFRELTRFAPDGSEVVKLELAASKHNWTGTIVQWDLVTLVDFSGGAFPALMNAEPGMEVPAGATDLWLTYLLTCPDADGGAGYTMAVAARPPAQGDWNDGAQCSGTIAFTESIVEAPDAGTWSFTFLFGGGPEAPLFDVELLARTRVDVPFGG